MQLTIPRTVCARPSVRLSVRNAATTAQPHHFLTDDGCAMKRLFLVQFAPHCTSVDPFVICVRARFSIRSSTKPKFSHEKVGIKFSR